MSRYRFVSAMKAEGFAVRAACWVAEVSTSSYYDWCAKVACAPSAAEWDEAHLVNEMHEIHTRLDDTYGSPRMTTELRRRCEFRRNPDTCSGCWPQVVTATSPDPEVWHGPRTEAAQ